MTTVGDVVAEINRIDELQQKLANIDIPSLNGQLDGQDIGYLKNTLWNWKKCLLMLHVEE